MQKSIIMSILIVLLVTTVHAADGPIDKGSMLIDGSIFFQYQGGDLYDNRGGQGLTTISITPGIGYFLSPGLMFGGEIALISLSQGNNSQTILSLGPVIGYYFNSDPTRTKIKGVAYPYMKALLGIGTISFGSGNSITQTMFGVQGGSVFMVSDAVGIDLGLKLQFENWSDNGISVSGTTILLGAGVKAFIW